MESTIHEVLDFIEENDVKFIRLAFCDLLGNQKNISIMPTQIERVFKEGISFDASAIRGFQDVDTSDLFLFPDASTLDILPWRPSVGRVIRFFCEIRYPDGRLYERDCRAMLKEKLRDVSEQGYRIMSGLECEFYVFHQDIDEKGEWEPLDRGGYLDVFPKDRGEDIRRDICLTLEEMGIYPESSHHEQGPGQNEIDFHFDDALVSCDHFMTFRWVVDSIADAHDVVASFLPKPLQDESGSGLHINLSLDSHKAESFDTSLMLQQFVAGILAHICDITLFLNPTLNSYERLGEFEAPLYVSWGRMNRSALIRIPAASKDHVRIEVRSADPSCNPYLASYLLICAGMCGIQEHMALQEESRMDLNQGEHDLKRLPMSLREAIAVAEQSTFVKTHVKPQVLASYIEYAKEQLKEKGL